MFKLSCILFFQSTSSDNMVLAISSYRCTWVGILNLRISGLCTTRFKSTQRMYLLFFLIYLKFLLGGCASSWRFLSPKFLQFLKSGEAPKDRQERGVRLGYHFCPPGNDHISLSSKYFVWWSHYLLFLVLGQLISIQP